MSTTLASPTLPSGNTPQQRVVNDFSIQVATANGSGSQTSNTVLMRALFQMGIPVSGKNMFPSNIQGLPTWFTIRASKHGWIARKKEIDFLVAMNPETANRSAPGVASTCRYEFATMPKVADRSPTRPGGPCPGARARRRTPRGRRPAAPAACR